MSDPILPGGEAGLREAPSPIPVRARYYLAKCPECGWFGSSEQCGVDHGCDDSDVYCPVCQSGGCEDDATQGEFAQHGEAVFQRISQLQSDRVRLEAENDMLRDVQEAVVARWRDAAMMAVNGDVRRLQRLLDASQQRIVGSPLPLDPSPQGEGGGA